MSAATSTTTFTIEHAKSGRATCKGCKNVIGKGELRIGTHSEVDHMHMTKWNHVGCFKLPRKYQNGPEAVTIAEFVRDVLQDAEGSISPGQAHDIVEQLEGAAAVTTKKSDKKAPGASKTTTGPLGYIEELHQMLEQAKEEGKEPPLKKIKSQDLERVQLYDKYRTNNKDDLVEILRWNQQPGLTGSKDVILARIIDGEIYGRLARCPLCRNGKLKLTEDGTKVACPGGYDEEAQRRVNCGFMTAPAEAPRWQPWYSQEPTEEEKEEIERIIEEATGEAGLDLSKYKDFEKQLVERAKHITWSLADKDNTRATARALLDLLDELDSPLDLPESRKVAGPEIQKILGENRSLAQDEVLKVIIARFGYKEAKEKAAEEKAERLQENTKIASNASIAAAFQELGGYYAKEQNLNAQKSCFKVADALMKMEFAVTEDNVLDLYKKNKKGLKVDGIGKSSAERIKEFLEKGTFDKLEEKRADHGGEI